MIRDREAELKRRKLELWLLVPLGLLFLVLNWFLFRLYNGAGGAPLSYAFLYFGLLNLNVLLFLAIVFFLGRNLVKIYAESKPRFMGSSLRSRLFMAFVSFAFVPTCLMFLVSVFYINNTFDRWFEGQTEEVLKKSSILTDQYISDLKTHVFYAANQILVIQNRKVKQSNIDMWVNQYGVDAIEFYNLKTNHTLLSLLPEKNGFDLPPLKLKEIRAYAKRTKGKSMVRKTEQGEWISAVVPFSKKGVLVVSKVLPFNLVETINELMTYQSDYKKTKEFKLPLKSSYLFMLITMTLLILAFGGWFSLYLAESLSKSLSALGFATQRISKGEFKPIKFKTGMEEINALVSNFNRMTQELKTTRGHLNQSVEELKERSIYMDTVLSQVTSGVVSCDLDFKVNYLNKKAQSLFKFVSLDLVLGQSFNQAFPKELAIFLEGFSLKSQNVEIKEFDLKIGNATDLALQMSVARLFGADQSQIGYIVAFENVDVLRENQRVRAWKEVATRVAHEIKNPLTPVKLSAERLHRKFSDQVSDPIFDQCIKTILFHVDLIKDLVNEFNYSAKLPSLALEKHDFFHFLKELVQTYKASHPMVVFELKFPSLEPMFFDKAQMKRVFINLIENSIEAMEQDRKKYIFVYGRLSASGQVLQVQFFDSGPGISKQNWKTVFVSRYTTKKTNSGLGLSIVKKIIESHGGRIAVAEMESVNKSAFIIDLPLKVKS